MKKVDAEVLESLLSSKKVDISVYEIAIKRKLQRVLMIPEVTESVREDVEL